MKEFTVMDAAIELEEKISKVKKEKEYEELKYEKTINRRDFSFTDENQIMIIEMQEKLAQKEDEFLNLLQEYDFMMEKAKEIF